MLRTKGYTRVLDLSGEEAGGRGRFLEGTGVLVLDRINGTAYVSLSDRADRVCFDRLLAPPPCDVQAPLYLSVPIRRRAWL